MLEVALHAGTDHPNLVWILIPAILSFVAGVGVGQYSDRVSEWFRSTVSTRE